MIAWWNRLDANRERRERYHELSRSGDDVPLDYGASANELFFPDTLNDVLEKQLRKGDFLDAIFYCPYDIHELVTEEYLSKILWELTEEHKELLFLCAVRLFSSTRIAKIRNQSDRNIRKVRGTMLKKIRKKLLPALWDKAEKQQPMTLLEKDFLEENMIPTLTISVQPVPPCNHIFKIPLCSGGILQSCKGFCPQFNCFYGESKKFSKIFLKGGVCGVRRSRTI